MKVTDDEPIPGLLAELEDLARAGRRAGAPKEAITLLERTRERIRYLMGDSRELPASGGAPETGPIASRELPGALGDLIVRAGTAGAPAWVTNLLSTAHLRLANEVGISHAIGADRRLAPRFSEDQAARLTRAGGERIGVLVVDRSPLGLGLLGEQPLDPHELIRLTLPGTVAGGTHNGEVVFCLARGDELFHIGVELLAMGEGSAG